MGHTTIKTGSSVIIKETGAPGTVERIEHGLHYIIGYKEPFFARDLKSVPTRPTPLHLKPKTPIKKDPEYKMPKVSDIQKDLNAIYSIIAPKFKLQNPECAAKLPGCTHKTEEIHHKYGREGVWLICIANCISICRSCHQKITEHSDMAINLELSIPRTVYVEYIVDEELKKLLPLFPAVEKKLSKFIQ